MKVEFFKTLFSRKSDLSGYAPYGARSRHELAAYEQFFDHQGQGIKVLVMLLATDNGTMTRDSHLNESVTVSLQSFFATILPITAVAISKRSNNFLFLIFPFLLREKMLQ